MINSIKSFVKIDEKVTDHGFKGVECVFPLIYQLDQCVHRGYSLYCLVSLAMSDIQSQKNFSSYFDKTGVSEIGRKSLWMSVGGLTLGIGRMSAHFHSMGTVPSRKLLLKIAQTGGAGMVA